MKIVIELREDTYEVIRRIGSGSPIYIDRAILEGIVLPKGHGRLIDADALDMGIVPFDGGDMCLSNTGKMIAEKIIKNAPTIIPADKEESE